MKLLPTKKAGKIVKGRYKKQTEHEEQLQAAKRQKAEVISSIGKKEQEFNLKKAKLEGETNQILKEHQERISERQKELKKLDSELKKRRSEKAALMRPLDEEWKKVEDQKEKNEIIKASQESFADYLKSREKELDKLQIFLIEKQDAIDFNLEDAVEKKEQADKIIRDAHGLAKLANDEYKKQEQDRLEFTEEKAIILTDLSTKRMEVENKEKLNKEKEDELIKKESKLASERSSLSVLYKQVYGKH